jgi:large repetitive protein
MLLVLGLIGWSPASTNIAQAASKSTPRATPGYPIRGESFTVTGRISTKVARPVELQKKAGSKWTRVATGQTNATGGYSFKTSTSASSAQLRVVAKKIKIGKKTYKAITSKVTKLRTVSVTPSSPMAGEAFTVAESLGKKGIRPVALQRKAGSRWATIAPAKTNSAGAFKVSAALSASADLRVVAAKTKIKKKKYSAITMKSFRVAIAAQSGSLSLASTGVTGQALIAGVEFTPARAGRTVELQSLVGSQWQTVASSVQSATGTATLGTAPVSAGTFSYRVVATAYNGAAATATDTREVKVTSGVAEPSIVIGTLAAAVAGEDYTTELVAAGGTAPFTWTATGLPDGLTLSPDGALRGTPTKPGTYEVHLKVTDADGKSTETTATIVVRPVVSIATIANNTLPPAIAGQTYLATVSGEGGTTPYTWSAAGLPAGLEISADGVISGTPTAAGSNDVELTITDHKTKTAAKTVTLTVTAALTLDTTTLPSGTVGTSYPETDLVAAGGAGGYSWSSTTLPAGLSLSQAGKLTGTPTQAGTFDKIEVTVTDDNGYTATKTLSIVVAAVFAITTTSLPGGVVGTAYSTTVATADGAAPYAWASTTLPAGLAIDATTGEITGSPTEAGTYDAVKITATDAGGKTAEATFTITIAKAVHITTATLPDGIVGTGYPETDLVAADGNSASYTWASTTLPDGLSLSPTGKLTGTPTTDGTYDAVKITATDAGGKTAEATFTITIIKAVHITTASLPAGVVGTSYPETQLAAADGNSTSYTWASTTLPAGLSLSETGELTGTPTSAGVYDAVKIIVTDHNGKTAEATFTITITQAVHITTASLPAGVVGTSYATTDLAAADGTPDYTWASTTLPAGLTLSETGTLSGTPTHAGTFDAVKIAVTDHNGKTAEATFTITIASAVHITTTNLPDGVVGTSYPETQLVAAAGNSTSYTWASTTLPAGLELSTNGLLTGTPSAAGTFDAVKITVTDADGKTAEATFTITVAPAVHITTTSLPAGVVGTSYPETDLAAADGNSTSYTWSSTNLPAGLSLSQAGKLTGTPTESGVHDSVKITVTDADGKTAEATFSISVAPAVHITTASLPAGVVGTSYPATQLVAADGTPDYTWASTTLPAGLTLSETGELTGTPTADGTTSVTFTATDTKGKTATVELSIAIAKAVHITTTALSDGVRDDAYPATTVTALDGAGPYTWASTTLPAGLEINTTTGEITGTPTTAATYDDVKIIVTDHNGKTAEAAFTITIHPVMAVTTAVLAEGVMNESYSATLSGLGGIAPREWQLTGLPTGLSLNTATGEITGTPTEAGSFDLVATLTDAGHREATRNLTLTIHPVVHITTASLPAGVVGTTYASTTLTAADGTPGYTWASSTLPTGLSLSEAGVLTGTPTTDGTFDAVKIIATDAAGKTAEATFSITITKAVHITTASLPSGVIGTTYSATQLAAADGTPSYTWASTTLPDGLSLSADGELTGTPTSVGVYDSVKIIATDHNGKTAEATFTITIAQAVHITTASLPSGVVGTTYAATQLAAADGTPDYTWASTTLPAGLNLSEAGLLTGTPITNGTFDAVKIIATDAAGKTAEATFSIAVVPGVHITTASLPGGVVGTDYTSTTLTAADGTPGYTWSSSALPDGLSLSETGLLTGTPTTNGTFDAVTITATDASGKTAEAVFPITIAKAVHITTDSLPAGVVGTAYPETDLAAADGNSASYSWASTTLPTGLSLSASGVLTGTPSADGTFDAVKIAVTDAAGKTAEATFTITVVPAVHITTDSLPAGVVGTSYPATTLTAADGNGSATWSSTALPAGLNLNETSGEITGTPSEAGTTSVTFTATDTKGKTATWETSIAVTAAVHITTTSLPAGVVGTTYTETTLAAADGNGSVTWSSTTLPDGLSLSEAGTLTGTPTTAGDTEVTFTATDPKTKTDTWTTTITVAPAVHITTSSLPSVEAGDAYPETALAAADGTPGYTWTSTTLPEGLALSSDGKLTGTPTTAGETTVTFTATDQNVKTATADLTISITPAVHLTSTLAIGVVGGGYTSTLTAEGGTAPYTISATSLPAGLTFTDGVISGIPTTAGTNTPVELTVTDAHSKTATTTLGLTVVKPKTEAAGANHSCAITPSGGVECWGSNTAGQLGDNTTINRTYPVRVSGLSGPAISVSAGGTHTCAVLKNGQIQCWGANTIGQLGAGDNIVHTVPVTVVGISSAVAVAAGTNFTCATMSSGTAACWGQGNFGQLGSGTSTSVYGPASVKNLTNVMDVQAGASHACALATTGSVSCWGRNNSRQVGAGGAAGTASYNTPVAVPDVSGVTSLGAHLGNHTCVTESTGAVKCWGNNGSLQLGATSPTTSGDALTVPGITDAVQAFTGNLHSCAVTSTGVIECWGSSYYGQLGDGTSGSGSANPVLVTNIGSAVTSASGGSNHSCARTAAGAVLCWGSNQSGQLANGLSGNMLTPLAVPTLTQVSQVSSGSNATCAVVNGGAKCWGVNTYGQLGNNSTVNSPTPVDVSGLTAGVTQVGVGQDFACALTSGGAVQCWGKNASGQLGNDVAGDSTTPVSVQGLGSGVTKITVGYQHACALTTAGAVKCWGYNADHELGDNSSTNRPAPVDVSGLSSGVIDVAAGQAHTCAVLSGGTLDCWGNNGNGELGLGTASGTIPTPTAVTGVSGPITSVSAGQGYTCALTASGTTQCWGNNGNGQLGDGTRTNHYSPADVSGLTGATALSAGLLHACVVDSESGVRCWGFNSNGQLGDGTFTDRTLPTTVSGLTDIRAVSSGYSHTCALTNSGTLACWGSNSLGELGQLTAFNPTPTAVTGFNVAPLTAGSISLDSGVVGTAYSGHELSASGGVAPYTWTATGLPAGLSVSSAGVVSGTPTETGTSDVTFTVTDVRGKTDSTTASITIAPAVHITSSSLPGGVINTAYSTQLEAADGTAPYTWTSDLVPDGLTLSADGVLSGTPTGTTPGTTLQITATDANGKTDTQALTIVITPVIHGAAALNAGSNLACALTAAGGVECWGKNQVGQLGGGTATPDSTTPVQVIGLSSGVRMVAAGAAHACALTDAGGVKCWGTNQTGQLGDGTTMGLRGDSTPYNSPIPVDVVGLTSGVKAISAGANHTCAVTNAGAVKCWGYNFAGALGNNSTANSNVPVDAAGLTSDITAIAGTNASTCALTSAGRVKCWGSNTNGQVGDGTTTDRWTPADVALQPGVTAVSITARGRTACVVTDSGGALCWGYNGNGELGNGLTTDSATPGAVTDLTSGVAAVTQGQFHACALTTAGAVKCWGDNTTGEVGDSTTTNRLTPVDVTGLSSGVASVSVGSKFSCAVLDSGAAKCWGDNTYGQGGNGFRTNTSTPTAVFGYGPVAVRIATSALPVGEVGHAYPATTINHAGGTRPYTWSASGLPAGLSIDTSTGVITGTPTEAGTFNAVTITLTDGSNATAQTTLIMTVIAAVHVTTSNLPTGVVVNTSYPATTVAADDGAAPYVWSATGLPSGLSLDASTGTITGTPTSNGTFSVAITATDHNLYAATTTLSLSVMAIAGATSDFTSIDGANTHTCAVNNVGGVECWGYNNYGQLGNGTTTDSPSPVGVTGLSSGVKAVAASTTHTCAVTNAGGVKCWGYNNYGQLGNGTTVASSTAVDVSGLTSDVTAISAGNGYSCAMTTGGGVKCWGSNANGQLGDGTSNNSSTPVDVSGLASGVTALSVGTRSACAVTTSGGLTCWGLNTYGQLGNGTTDSSATPVNVTGLASGVGSVAVGAGHACALATTGVKCWGYNGYGQLGNTTTIDSLTPVDVTGLASGISNLTAGNNHTCAITTTGGVKCWGYNSYGQLGDGTTASSTTPVGVIGLTSGVTNLTGGANHTCAITGSHDVVCWGNNPYGQLGNGQVSMALSALTPTGLASGITAAAAGYNHTCALTSSGGVECWGENVSGALGNGTTTSTSTAVQVSGLSSGVSEVTTGGGASCALTSGGGVKCWGNNSNGQLGNGTTTNATTPVDVNGLTSGVTAITAGGTHTCALTSGGGVKCWGNNFAGAVGDSTTNDRYSPVDVSGLTSGVTAITAGGSHTCALTSGGGVKCWGYNEAGELGNGTTTSATSPVDVTGLTSGVTAVDAGGSQTCTLTTTGGVKCWGYNGSGQLGNGTTTDTNAPVDVTGLTSGMATINVGAYHACALTTTGGMKCWGQGAFGQLGNGTTANATSPVDVTGLTSGLASISAGKQHTCAVSTAGALKCWGSNAIGQLGNSAVITLTPEAVVGHTFTPTT